MAELIYPDESYRIMGACFEVYNRMGSGFLEPVYQECLAIEFEYQAIPFVAQFQQKLYYRDRELVQVYKPDFLCFESILVEIKALSELNDNHRAQVLNYLHAGKFRLGILVNFGNHPKLCYERIVL